MVMHGWLFFYRKENGVKTWSHRWFILRESDLQYGKREKRVNRRASVLHGKVVVDESKSSKHQFTVKSPEVGLMHLRAETEDEMMAWVFSLRAACDGVPLPSGLLQGDLGGDSDEEDAKNGKTAGSRRIIASRHSTAPKAEDVVMVDAEDDKSEGKVSKKSKSSRRSGKSNRSKKSKKSDGSAASGPPPLPQDPLPSEAVLTLEPTDLLKDPDDASDDGSGSGSGSGSDSEDGSGSGSGGEDEGESGRSDATDASGSGRSDVSGSGRSGGSGSGSEDGSGSRTPAGAAQPGQELRASVDGGDGDGDDDTRDLLVTKTAKGAETPKGGEDQAGKKEEPQLPPWRWDPGLKDKRALAETLIKFVGMILASYAFALAWFLEQGTLATTTYPERNTSIISVAIAFLGLCAGCYNRYEQREIFAMGFISVNTATHFCMLLSSMATALPSVTVHVMRLLWSMLYLAGDSVKIDFLRKNPDFVVGDTPRWVLFALTGTYVGIYAVVMIASIVDIAAGVR